MCRRDAANARWANGANTAVGSTLAARFWSKVATAGEEDCWLWTGARVPNGYGALGRVEVDGKVRSQVGAHRVAFYLTHGRWPAVARHSCDNRGCVNPSHIVDGTHADNARDAVDRGRHPVSTRTECPQGHPYSAENTYREPLTGYRHCRTCRR